MYRVAGGMAPWGSMAFTSPVMSLSRRLFVPLSRPYDSPRACNLMASNPFGALYATCGRDLGIHLLFSSGRGRFLPLCHHAPDSPVYLYVVRVCSLNANSEFSWKLASPRAAVLRGV